jgi:hypothetical protein
VTPERQPFEVAEGSNTIVPRRLLFSLVVSVLAIGLTGCYRKSANTPTAGAGIHKITLTWRASSTQVSGYRVYRAANPNDPPSLIAVTPGGATQFVDVTVADGRTYFYVVTAFDSANKESAPSNKVSATVPHR